MSPPHNSSKRPKLSPDTNHHKNPHSGYKYSKTISENSSSCPGQPFWIYMFGIALPIYMFRITPPKFVVSGYPHFGRVHCVYVACYSWALFDSLLDEHESSVEKRSSLCILCLSVPLMCLLGQTGRERSTVSTSRIQSFSFVKLPGCWECIFGPFRDLSPNGCTIWLHWWIT